MKDDIVIIRVRRKIKDKAKREALREDITLQKLVEKKLSMKCNCGQP